MWRCCYASPRNCFEKMLSSNFSMSVHVSFLLASKDVNNMIPVANNIFITFTIRWRKLGCTVPIRISWSVFTDILAGFCFKKRVYLLRANRFIVNDVLTRKLWPSLIFRKKMNSFVEEKASENVCEKIPQRCSHVVLTLCVMFKATYRDSDTYMYMLLNRHTFPG